MSHAVKQHLKSGNIGMEVICCVRKFGDVTVRFTWVESHKCVREKEIC